MTHGLNLCTAVESITSYLVKARPVRLITEPAAKLRFYILLFRPIYLLSRAMCSDHPGDCISQDHMRRTAKLTLTISPAAFSSWR